MNNGVVYFGDNEGLLYAIDSETGRQRWSYNTFSVVDLLTDYEVPFVNTPTVVDGVVYFGTRDGYLYAIYAD